MAEVAELHIKIISDKVKVAEQRLSKLERQSKRNELTANKLNSSFSRTEKGAVSLSKGLLGLSSAYAALSIGQRAFSSAFNNTRELERLNAMLKTSEGSIEGARIQMEKLEKLSTQMPETLADVSQAFILAKNLGIDPTERSMISFGNTAVAMGKNINQFTQAVADAMTLEFERLKEFGIRARNEGKTIRFIFKGTETQVENSSTAIIEYLTQLGETEFSGSMADQMDTLSGKLSNLEDAWFKFTNQVAGFDWAKSGIGQLTGYLNRATDESKYRDFITQVLGQGFGGGQGLASVTESQIPQLDRLLSGQRRGLEEALARGDEGATERRLKSIENIEKRLFELRSEAWDRENLQIENDHLQKVKSFKMGVEDIEQKTLKAQREKYSTSLALLSIEEEIKRIKEQGFAGDGSVDSQLRELEKLEEKKLELEVKRGREIISAKSKIEGFLDEGRSDEERLQEKHGSEMAFLIAAHNDKLIAEKEFLDKKKELESEHERERREIQIKGITGQLGEARDFFSELGVIAQGENKKIFEINKAFALADATVRGSQAVNKALAEGGMIKALMVGAKAAIEIATINSTEFAGNFASGGFVGGTSYTGDRMRANVNSGEAILTSSQQREFMKLANGRGGGAKITINNYGGSKVETKEGADGSLSIDIDRISALSQQRVARDIQEGDGPVSRAMAVARRSRNI